LLLAAGGEHFGWKFDEARNVPRIALVVAGDDARAKAEAERLLATIPEKK
jgi:predicted dinucleotide-binding enzyme